MKPRVLFVIDSDPRTSPRPAEAVRIATGVAAWKKVEVSVYLRGAAILILGEEAEGLIDGENFTHHLPLLNQSSQSIYAQKAAPLLTVLGEASHRFTVISDEELASLSARQTYLLRF